MRTTLTLDDEVVLGIRNLQKKRPNTTFKRIVNDVIKEGLEANGEVPLAPFKIKPLKNSNPRPGLNFENINALISQVEGDFHK